MFTTLEINFDTDGVGMLQEMEKLGFGLKNGTQPSRTDIKAFVELHIEQGNVLELNKKYIGVVNAIAGQKRYTGKIVGQANHAGTTPMKFRKDAVYAFSKMCNHLIEKAMAFDDTLVLTFGHLDIAPNIVNVVPGEVDFSIDCRHPDAEKLEQFVFEMEHDIDTLQKELGITIELNRWMDAAPVKMNDELVNLIEQTAKKDHLPYQVMHSGAGHDSQMIAPYFPTAMIFVPSIEGISHSPDEDTKIEDLTLGVNFLAQVLYELAYKD